MRTTAKEHHQFYPIRMKLKCGTEIWGYRYPNSTEIFGWWSTKALAKQAFEASETERVRRG